MEVGETERRVVTRISIERDTHHHPFWTLIQRPKFKYSITIWKILIATLLGFPAILMATPLVDTPLGEPAAMIVWLIFAGIYFWWDYTNAREKFSIFVASLDLLSERAAIVEHFVDSLDDGFSPTIYSVTPGGGSFIAIDEDLLTLRIGKFDFDKSPEGDVWTFDDILGRKLINGIPKSAVS